MYLVLVAGGHASGKRTVTNDIQKLLTKEAEGKVHIETKAIDLCNYASAKQQHPKDVNFAQLRADLHAYESTVHDIPKQSHFVVFVFGNYALYDDQLCDLASLKLFLDTDADVRLSRWILRDAINTKKMHLGEVLQTYLDRCRMEFSDFIEGTKVKADVLLPQGSDPLTTEVVVSGIISELTTGESAAKDPVRRPVINLRDEENGTFYVTD